MSKDKIVLIILLVCLAALAIMHPNSQLFGKVIYKVDTEEDVVFLTFDDGPGTETEEILGVLNQKDVRATFFVVGDRIWERPEMLKRIKQEGHSIGVHSMTHPLMLLNNKQEIEECKELIEKISGYSPKYFRPPYGFRTPWTIKAAENSGLKTMTWSSFPYDYKREKQEIIDAVLSDLKPGLIICLHDGPTKREETLAALPELIGEIRKRGYELSELD